MIKQYLLSIIIVAMLVSIATKCIPPKSTHGTVIRFMSGIFIVLTIVGPISKFKIDNYISFYDSISGSGQTQVDLGINIANTTIRQVIKEETEAYILEKAEALGAELTAEITLDSGDEPYPVSVIISGDVSPYVKKQLCAIICNDIGIPEEMQKWM